MDGARVTMARGAKWRPYYPANFTTYAVAAFVTFVGLGFRCILSANPFARFTLCEELCTKR